MNIIARMHTEIQKGILFFQCDYKTNSITLGDVTSNPRKVLNVPLNGGGHLKVNVDNLEELSHAMGIFSYTLIRLNYLKK